MSTAQEQKAIAKAACDAFRKSKHNPALVQQKRTGADRPAPKGLCTSNSKLPPPSSLNTDARSHFLEAVANLETGQEAFALPKYGDIKGEWIGLAGGNVDPDFSEKQKYDFLTKARKSDVTIMYAHGGAYAFGGPVNARPSTVPFCTYTGGLCFAIRYRLAPQVQALSLQLDVFIAYLSLLYPPPGAFHAPVPPAKLVMAGDSSGACLIFAILQIILQLRRQQQTLRPVVRWYGKDVEVPVPACITGLGAASDHLLCLPSYQKNQEHDMMNDVPPYRSSIGKTDSIWPTNPPRGDISCELSAMSSIMYNPGMSPSWKGSPPMWLACGEERFSDGTKMLAQRAAEDGVEVQFEEYAIMPHIFPHMVPKLPQSKRCIKAWADFIVQRCSGSGEGKKSSAIRIEAGQLEVTKLDITRLVDFTVDEARVMMKNKLQTLRVWEGPWEASEQAGKL